MKSKSPLSALLVTILSVTLLLHSACAYENTQYGFSINPPEEWAVGEKTEPIMFVFKDPSNQTGATITILVNQSGLPQDDPFLASLKQLYLEQYLFDTYPDYLITQRGARVAGSLNGYQVKFNASVDGREMRFDSVIFIETNQTFIIICGALSPAYDNLSSVFRESINSFRIAPSSQGDANSTPHDNATVILIGVGIAVFVLIVVSLVFILGKGQKQKFHAP